jgi:hypothetical protein
MTTAHAAGTFETTTWDEQTYSEIEGAGKLTRVSATDVFRGDIEADATTAYVMAYRADGSGSFMGLQRVVGRVGDRSGSFVLQHSGTFTGDTDPAAAVVTATWTVVPDSGTGALRGLRGEGGYVWEGQHGQGTPCTLDYDLE